MLSGAAIPRGVHRVRREDELAYGSTDAETGRAVPSGALEQVEDLGRKNRNQWVGQPQEIYGSQTSRRESLADPERLELPTSAFEAHCSIQLSYGSTEPGISLAGLSQIRQLSLPARAVVTVPRFRLFLERFARNCWIVLLSG
jgi:hypothetical protein